MKNKKIKHKRTYCMTWKRCTSLCINLSPSCYWEGQIWLARVPARTRDMMGLSDLPRGQRGLLPLIESLYSRNHLLLPLFPNPSNSDGIRNFSCKKTFLSECSLTPVLLEKYCFFGFSFQLELCHLPHEYPAPSTLVAQMPVVFSNEGSVLTI